MARAAILRSLGGRLELVDVTVLPPGPGEVMVGVAVSGTCDHDLACLRGEGSLRRPLVLGHGGSGVVLEVGPGVTSVAEGDHVVLCGPTQCGTCYWCRRGEGVLCPVGNEVAAAGTMLDGSTRVQINGTSIGQLLSIGSFSSVTVVPEHSAVPIHASIDLATAALISCGVLEGLGAATRAATVAAGDVVVVLGNGSVGRNALQGARFGGAGAILVLGDEAGMLEEDLGATHVTATPGQVDEWIQELTDGRGADVVIDTLGADDSAKRALGWSRRGGQVVLASARRGDPPLPVRVYEDLVSGARTLRGGWSGSIRPREDVPILLELHESGLLRLDAPRSATVALDDARDALSLLESGDLQQVLLTHS